MSIAIMTPGILDTVQDHGRQGYGSLGIQHNGMMDSASGCTANIVAGNVPGEALLEMHFPAASVRFDKSCIIGIAGADFSAHINSIPVPIQTPILVPEGAVLEFRQWKRGARVYLAVGGGLNIKPWLNSASTNLAAGAGGYNGRALRGGDVIGFKQSMKLNTNQVRILPWHADLEAIHAAGPIRFIRGSEYGLLTDCAETILEGNSFLVSAQSNRMGYRLTGTPLPVKETRSMISSGVTRGTIQLLPSGQLVILMADHQTTGGYPRIGHVVLADIPRLAQMPVNSSLRFEATSPENAETLLKTQNHHLQLLRSATSYRLQEYLQTYVTD